MTRNLQTIEKRSHELDGHLDVHSIFDTIQGEGPYAGHPAIFIRLAGCNLQCEGCDTEYTGPQRRMLHFTDLVREVNVLWTKSLRNSEPEPLVVVTGGEPFRQPCGKLVNQLRLSGYFVQFETNGTLFDTSISDSDWDEISVVCSPKTNINALLMPHISALKYVMKAGEMEADGLPAHALDSDAKPQRPWCGYDGPIYLQPYDEGHPARNADNLQTCIESCMKFGYILSLQLHKLAGLP